MSLSNVLRLRRNELGLTLAEIADKVGVSEATVQRWESGNIKNIRQERIANLAKVLQVSPAYLMGWEDEKTAPSLPPDAFPYNPTHRIPILGRISAGLPLYADQNLEGYTYTTLNGGAEYFGLRVKGDSMNAMNINDGYLVIVRRQEIVDNGSVAVVMVGDDEATLKRFYQNGNVVTLMPQSTNPTHLPQIYDLKYTSVKIIGLVVKVEFTI